MEEVKRRELSLYYAIFWPDILSVSYDSEIPIVLKKVKIDI